MIGELYKSNSNFKCGEYKFKKGIKYNLINIIEESSFTLYVFEGDLTFCEFKDVDDKFIERFDSVHEERVREVNKILYG